MTLIDRNAYPVEEWVWRLDQDARLRFDRSNHPLHVRTMDFAVIRSAARQAASTIFVILQANTASAGNTRCPLVRSFL